MAKKKAASQNKADPMPNEIEATGVIKGTETAVSLSGSEPEARFPIVGIGASAGGLEAFSQFFSNMPADSGIAFVLVQHLSASYKSMLDELVQRYTEMTVHQVEDGMKVEPNQVYIIPPDRDLALLHETLYLIEPVATDGLRHSIDFFFRSLAQDRGEESVGIVLSGTGSDGTLGLREIMGAGGFVMVQDPDSTQYDGMPRSAINTGLVHTILTPDKMPAQLITYVKGIYAMKARQTELPTEPVPADSLHKIHVLLRMHTGHDFSYYKQNTIRRRIQRRMVVNQIERLQDYERYLKLNAEEIDILYKDLLIGVTNFFRDIDAFAALEEQVIPKLFANKSMDQSIRIWCPGCATGEEPYSLAMLLQEYMSRNNQSVVVQIFATDINDEAITQARTGMFAEGIVTDLAPERLQRFFTKENGAYEINKSIRDMVIFAAQNVIFDPPFSKLDLISCRNLLIYLGPELQSKVLSMFHYALNQDGFLFLGNSESIGEHTDIFTVLDRKAKLFQRKGLISPQRNAEKFMLPVMRNVKGGITKARGKAEKKDLSLRELTETLLLTSYTPTAILINEKCDILYIHGRSGKFLEPAVGEANFNLLRMAREGLRMGLTTAIRRVITQQQTVTIESMPVRTNGDIQPVNLTIVPLSDTAAMEGLMLVLLEETGTATIVETAVSSDDSSSSKDQHIAKLEQDLQASEAYLQVAVEELDTAFEELKSTNEELQSSNEELQSSNEEMETSKEELQSINEELITVNAELQQKNEALTQAYDVMNNLIASTQIGTIFLDLNMRVQRFTPEVTQIINLIQTDIGRPMNHIVSKLKIDRLTADVQGVLDTLVPTESEVETEDGNWYLVRTSLYRTLENIIGGVVITFRDITTQKKAYNLSRLATVVRDANDAITMIDFSGQILAWNPKAEQIYGWSEAEALTMNIRDIVPANKQADALTVVERVAQGENVDSLETVRLCKNGRIVRVRLVVTELVDEAGQPYAISTTEQVLHNEDDRP